MTKLPPPEVKWSVEPEFRLVHEDREFRRFVCDKPGQALLVYGTKQLVVKFEKGWPTDIASTPLIFQIFVPQIGPHAPAAILHDRLLEMGMDRDTARRWMWAQLQQLEKVHKCRRYMMYAGVWIWDTFAAPLEKGFRW